MERMKWRNGYLLLVSYLLYANWNPAYALILLGITAVTYLLARQFEGSRSRKKIIVGGAFLTLLPLLIFKYYNFINESVYALLSVVGLRFQLPGLNWAIPMGISFFTFQALGYLFDVYYKRISAEKDFLIYALFISFFPSIVAGPINKASFVIPQLRALRPYFNHSKAVEGMKMLLWGMFMKVVVADRLALYVDKVYSSYVNYSGVACFEASILYSIQIYADFAGYSLMAIGIGKTLGFELTENFRRPYFSYSVTDFWHRWHISLSAWLKDYVYIPMGGSRCSRLRCYWNILITFLVSGVWHGANWTYIIWGAIHGICQIIEKILGQQKCKYGIVGKMAKIAITFLVINFAWIFFRSSSIGDAVDFIDRFFDLTLPLIFEPVALIDIVFILWLFLADLLEELKPNHHLFFENKYAIVRYSSYIVVLLMIMLSGILSESTFIYAVF